MEKVISAEDAKREFSKLLQGVRRGYTYVVTSDGKAMAKISPIDDDEKMKIGARKTLLARLRRQSVVSAHCWKREELYEDAR